MRPQEGRFKSRSQQHPRRHVEPREREVSVRFGRHCRVLRPAPDLSAWSGLVRDGGARSLMKTGRQSDPRPQAHALAAPKRIETEPSDTCPQSQS